MAYCSLKFPLPSTCNSPNFVGVEKSHVDAGVKGFSPLPAIVMKSFASKIGMPRVFKRKVTEDFTLAPILIVRPSLVVTVSDVSPLSTLTHPSFGIPAIAATPSTSFSFSEVSYGTRESGRVVVVVVVGATVVVVGATVVEVVEVVVVVGMVVSISRDSDGLVVESFPALSVTTAVTVHVPLVSVNKSQVDAMVES